VTDTSTGPLAGVRILDLTRALSGPFATLMLRGLGAEIVRIEEPSPTPRENSPFLGRDGVSLRRLHPDDLSIGLLIRHRGKQSITLNLKHPDASAVFQRLVPNFDVVVENYTRGTADRLGVGYAAAAQVRPDVVYCSISGFGQEGTPGGGKAMDTVIQAMSGAMLTSGSPGDPPVRVGVPLADLSTPLFAVIGIVSALFERQRTGRGQYIDVSMLGALTALQAAEPFQVLEDLGIPMRTGQTMPRLAPFGVYPARDGHVVLCCSGDRNFHRLVDAMGQPGLAEDPRFVSQVDRIHNFAAVDALVSRWTEQRTIADITDTLDRAQIASAPVRSPDQANRDERVLRRGEVVRLRHPTYGGNDDLFGPGIPISFSRTPAALPDDVADLGEHNDAIYGALLGWSADEVEQRRRDKLI
jgi:CoA:oxalate CoA-transferase